jgi:hypothetical protein
MQPKSSTAAHHRGAPTATADTPSDDLVVVTQMVEAYRSLALAAVQQLARLTRERDTARSSMELLRAELRMSTGARAGQRQGRTTRESS